MKPIFSHINLSSLRFRLIIAILISFSFIITDELGIFKQIRIYTDNIICPFYLLSNSSYKFLDKIYNIFSSHSQLEKENIALHKELLLKNSELLMLKHCQQENMHLFELLGSPLRQNEQKIITKVISTISNPYINQVIIDKGSIDGIYEGQPVINSKGVVGQVISVSKLTSRVILICDAAHALPIQVLRNGIRVIATGNGNTDILCLEHLPMNTDIHVGDELVTSGLDGRFPEGYPVAVVSSVKSDFKRAYVVIHARPTAGLQHLRYLLLLRKINFNYNSNLITPE